MEDALCELLRDGLRRPATARARLQALHTRAIEIGLRGEPDRGPAGILQRLLTQLLDTDQAGTAPAIAALRELLHWLALAQHAAPALDIETTERR